MPGMPKQCWSGQKVDQSATTLSIERGYMAEEPTKCDTGINSIASLELPRREIVKFRDLVDYLESSMSALE